MPAANSVGRGQLSTCSETTPFYYMSLHLSARPPVRGCQHTNENQHIPQTAPITISLRTHCATRALLDRWQPITDRTYTSK